MGLSPFNWRRMAEPRTGILLALLQLTAVCFETHYPHFEDTILHKQQTSNKINVYSKTVKPRQGFYLKKKKKSVICLIIGGRYQELQMNDQPGTQQLYGNAGPDASWTSLQRRVRSRPSHEGCAGLRVARRCRRELLPPAQPLRVQVWSSASALGLPTHRRQWVW